jgi:hypothetical protein
MAKSLIRKNQLHPDVSDLVTEYGNLTFVKISEFQSLSQFLINTLNLNQSFTVFTTGNQTINGSKNFSIRPTVNNTGVLLVGDLPNNLLYTTGVQSITGPKDFTTRPTLNGIGLATTGENGGGTTAFDGNRPITRTTINGVTPGGDNIASFLDNLFYPFVSASISLNSYSTQELGRAFNNVPFTVDITANSENSITNLSLFNNGNPVLENLTPLLGNNTYATTLSLSSNSTLAARININNNGNPTQISGLSSIQFEAPHYFGSGINNLQTNPVNMKSVLTKQPIMLEPSSRQLSVTTNGFYYFVYPDNWGALSKISAVSPPLDFNISSDFVTGNVTLTLENNSNYLYRFYKNTNQIILNNYGIVYHF